MQIYGDFEDFLQIIVHEVWVVILHDIWIWEAGRRFGSKMWKTHNTNSLINRWGWKHTRTHICYRYTNMKYIYTYTNIYIYVNIYTFEIFEVQVLLFLACIPWVGCETPQIPGFLSIKPRGFLHQWVGSGPLLSNEKRAPGCSVFFFGGDFTATQFLFMEVIIKHGKDPY